MFLEGTYGGQSHSHSLAMCELTPFLSLVTYYILLEVGAGFLCNIHSWNIWDPLQHGCQQDRSIQYGHLEMPGFSGT